MIDEEFDFNIFIKNLTAIDAKINMIVEEHEPKEKVRIEDKKGVISILYKTRKKIFDYYFDPNTIIELHKKYQHNKR